MEKFWKSEFKYTLIPVVVFVALAPVAWNMGAYQVEHAQKRTVAQSYEEYVVRRTCKVVRYDEPKYYGFGRNERVDMEFCATHTSAL